MTTQQPDPAPFGGPPPAPTPPVPGSQAPTAPQYPTPQFPAAPQAPIPQAPTPQPQPAQPQPAQAGYSAPPPAGGYQAPQGAYPPPGYGAPQQGAYPPPGYQGQGYPPPVAARPTVNPFTGIPMADLIRDGIAFVLLLVSLGLPWNGYGWSDQSVGDRDLIEVLLVTLLTALAVGVPYLTRAGVFPTTWTLAKTRRLRLGLAAPYVLVILIHIVIQATDASHAVRFGTAMAFGLTGVVLLAQPRGYELDSESAWAEEMVLWRKIYIGFLAAVGLGYLVTLIFVFKDLSTDGVPGRYLWANTVAVLLAAAFVLVPAGLAVVKRSPAWRRVVVCLGVAFLVIAFFGIDDESFLPRTEVARGMVGHAVINGMVPLSTWVGLGFFLFPAIAAIAASSVFARAFPTEDDGLTWVKTAAAALWVLAGVAVATIVSAAFVILEVTELNKAYDGMNLDGLGISTAKGITTLVLALIIAAAASYAGSRLWAGAPEGRMLAVGAAGLSLIVGIVIIVIAPDSRYLYGGMGSEGSMYAVDKKLIVTLGHLLLAFGLPIIIGYALYGPRSVRERFAMSRPVAPMWGQAPALGGYGAPAPVAYPAAGQPTSYDAGQPAPPQPAQYNPASSATGPSAPPPVVPYVPAVSSTAPSSVPVQPATFVPAVATPAPGQQTPAQPAVPPNHSFTAAQAADPTTAALVLAQIVQDAPELRAAVASNPSTYPALLEWLALVKDPAIDAALAARR